MASYIDGFVFPIPVERIDDYKRVAATVAEIYKQHGAVDYVEFVGDDLHREGTRSFPETVNATSDETVVFGWIVFESRDARDLVNQKVEADPRMQDLLAPLFDPANPIFDPSRMAYAGFKPLVGTLD